MFCKKLYTLKVITGEVQQLSDKQKKKLFHFYFLENWMQGRIWLFGWGLKWRQGA